MPKIRFIRPDDFAPPIGLSEDFFLPQPPDVPTVNFVLPPTSDDPIVPTASEDYVLQSAVLLAEPPFSQPVSEDEISIPHVSEEYDLLRLNSLVEPNTLPQLNHTDELPAHALDDYGLPPFIPEPPKPFSLFINLDLERIEPEPPSPIIEEVYDLRPVVHPVIPFRLFIGDFLPDDFPVHPPLVYWWTDIINDPMLAQAVGDAMFSETVDDVMQAQAYFEEPWTDVEWDSLGGQGVE